MIIRGKDNTANLDKFAFDTSCLPREFEKAEIQILFIDAVKKALGKLGNGEASYMAATIGLLLIEGENDPESPTFFTHVKNIHTELSGSVYSHFTEDSGVFNIHTPENAQRIVVYQQLYEIINKSMGNNGVIFFQDFALLGRKAADSSNPRSSDTWGFNNVMRSPFISNGATGNGNGGVDPVELPPLSDSDDHIEPASIHAVSVIHFAVQLEHINLFRVTDRIVELFGKGLLRFDNDEVEAKLFVFYRRQADRLGEEERWSLYARTLGTSRGQVSQDDNPNTTFDTLLFRFIFSISEFDRKKFIERLFDQRSDSGRSLSTNDRYVRKACLDLVANISLYVGGAMHFVAIDLARHITEAMEILQLSQVRDSYGVNTPWQVIELVSQREFDSAVNVVKHRTLAEETYKILNLIADKQTIWNLSTNRPLFSLYAGSEGAEKAVDNPLSTSGRFNNGLDPATTISDARVVFGKSGSRAPQGDLSLKETQILFQASQYWLAANRM